LLASPSRQLLRRRSSALGQDRRCCRAGARALPPRNQSPWASWVFGLAQRAACIRQELALRARDRPRCGHPGSARSVWHQFGINRWLAPWTAVPGPRGGFVPDDQRDEARACSGGWLARAWPLQRASLRRNRARRPRFYHGGIRRAHLSDRHPCSLQSCQLACAAELPSDQFASPVSFCESERGPHSVCATVLAAAGYVPMRDHYADPPVRTVSDLIGSCIALHGPKLRLKR
jgi:hypothetical protein